MRLKLFFIFLCLLSGMPVMDYAQYENVWMFGRNAGLDFNNGAPQPVSSSMNANEGCASICDVNGQLLFYTDGDRVWNRNHNLMPDGSGLTGVGVNAASSTSQGALIIPVPGSVQRYYIFSIGCWECGSFFGNLYYSIVDMSLNGGLGDIVPGSKGILMGTSFTEHMTAVAGDNCNVWLVLMSRSDGNFRSYNISTAGISTTPVISTAISSAFGDYTNIRGYMDISPDRSKLAIAKGNLCLYNFDPATGSITHPVPLILFNGAAARCYGVAFSPGGSKLYANRDTLPDNAALLQYDLSSGDSLTIVNSGTIIAGISWAVTTALKRGPDGKIYSATAALSVNPAGYLGVIQQPELQGIACQFVPNGQPLLAGTSSRYGLPNSNANVFYNYTKHYSSTLLCGGNYTLSALNLQGAGYLWENGDPGATRVVNSAGTYWVHYTAVVNQCVEEFTDTFKVLDMPPELYTSTTYIDVCRDDSVVLQAADMTGTDYTWSNGSTGPVRTVNGSGQYWVSYHEPGNECRLYADSFTVQYPGAPYNISFDVDSFLCQDIAVALVNTSGSYFNRYTWYFGDADSSTLKDPVHTYQVPGSYEIMLVASKDNHCADTVYKTVTVDERILPQLLASPAHICTGETIFFRHLLPETVTLNELQWLWGDGSELVTNDSMVRHAYDRAGAMPVSLHATFRACPAVFLSDTVHVYALPLVDLGADTTLCLDGAAMVMRNQAINTEPCVYAWNTGASLESIEIKHPGMYSLTLTTSHGCSSTETVTVRKDCYADIPNAFTPNGDQVNDYFLPRQLLSRGVNRFDMQIFNRWGQVIFETNRTDGRGWDGRFNGKEQPEGVYIYRIAISFKNGRQEQYQGNVTLIR